MMKELQDWHNGSDNSMYNEIELAFLSLNRGEYLKVKQKHPEATIIYEDYYHTIDKDKFFIGFK